MTGRLDDITLSFDVIIITGNDIVALPAEMSRALIETQEYVLMEYNCYSVIYAVILVMKVQ